jgi:hypothetical protein
MKRQSFDLVVVKTFLLSTITVCVALAAAALLVGCGGSFDADEPVAEEQCGPSPTSTVRDRIPARPCRALSL